VSKEGADFCPLERIQVIKLLLAVLFLAVWEQKALKNLLNGVGNSAKSKVFRRLQVCNINLPRNFPCRTIFKAEREVFFAFRPFYFEFGQEELCTNCQIVLPLFLAKNSPCTCKWLSSQEE